MPEISRRALLSRSVLAAGVVIGAGLGFSRHVHHKVATPPPQPPAALTDALAGQVSLLAGYDQVVTAPAGLKADVTEHGQALRALLELYPGWRLAQAIPASAPAAGPTSTAAGPAVPQTMAELAGASTALARALSTTALSWPAAEANAELVVPSLASIAASLTTHAAVLA